MQAAAVRALRAIRRPEQVQQFAAYSITSSAAPGVEADLANGVVDSQV
jgi:hypothetical protein